jgi:pimeloyl-ACP methyl ester carboxylesterase
MVNVILLHGFCEHKAMWAEAMNALSEGRNMHALDLCGFGDNDKVAKSMKEYAKDVFRQMDERGMDKAVVLGHSMGGYVALEMMNLLPERFLALGLIHSNAAPDDEARKEARQKQIEFLHKHDTKPYLKPFSEQLVGRSNRNAALTNRTWELVKNTQAPAIINALSAMKIRSDHRDLIRRTETPVFWLLGDEDDFMDLDDVLKQVANTNKAQLNVLNGVGHLGTWEAPEQTHQAIDSFLRWVLS